MRVTGKGSAVHKPTIYQLKLAYAQSGKASKPKGKLWDRRKTGRKAGT